MWNHFTHMAALLAALTGVQVELVQAFAPPTFRTTATSTIRAASTKLSLSADDAVSIVQSGAESFLNIISNAESPVDVWTQLPNEAKGVAAAAVGLQLVTQVAPNVLTVGKSFQQLGKDKKQAADEISSRSSKRRSDIVTYPEGRAATYEMNENVVPFEFGDAAFVRPLLKQTQLETRPLQVVYDANRDGYDASTFHSKVDGKGAAVVLAKVGGQWCGGYNPRGWASLGQARSSVAAFLFYKQPLKGWQKVRVARTGSMACGNDNFDAGIVFGADAFVIPLCPPNRRSVASRLGQYFEAGPGDKTTILPRPGISFDLQELKVLTGVYAPGEDIPNSGGVLELGYY